MDSRLLTLYGTQSGRYMSKEDAALQLHCTVTDVCKLMANGDIPLIKIDELWYTTKAGVDKYERSIKPMTKNNKQWIGVEYMDENMTAAFLARTPRSTSSSKLARDLAVEMQNMKPGTAKQFLVPDDATAKRIQNQAREGARLAGWFDKHRIPRHEMKDWVVWRTSILKRSDGKCIVTVVHLEEKKQSLSVAMRKNRIKELQEKGRSS